MKTIRVFCFLITLTIATGCPKEPPKAKIELMVVDESGKLMPNEPFKYSIKGPLKIGKTSANGTFIVEVPSLGGIGFECSKAGYYDSAVLGRSHIRLNLEI